MDIIRGNGELMEHFPPVRSRKRLKFADVKRMVEAVRPGLDVPANLERHPCGWRLRVTFNKPNGGVVRRGITLPDDETAAWVAEYLEGARMDWRDRKRAETERENQRRFEELVGGVFPGHGEPEAGTVIE
jgi:hypothetical protein